MNTHALTSTPVEAPVVTVGGARSRAWIRRGRTQRPVIAPPPAQRAPVWERAVPVAPNAMPDERPPLVWLLAAHGGAGASSLERLLSPAADCHRRWPSPVPGESPYVLVVARETSTGLAAADALLRQHHAGLAGDSVVVGLVTVAAQPGRVPAPIRRDRELYCGLVEAHWRIDWHEAWIVTDHASLPVWHPDDPPRAARHGRDRADVPLDVELLGQQLVTAIAALDHRLAEERTRL